MRAAFDLLVQPLQHIGRFHVLMVGQRQPVVRSASPRCSLPPELHSRGYLLPHLPSHAARSRRTSARLAPVVDPAQLLQAVVVGPARQMIQRIAQEVHVAALPGRLASAPRGSPAGSPGWSSDTMNSTPYRPRCFSPNRKSRQLDPLSRVARSTPSTCRRPVGVDRDRDQHRLAEGSRPPRAPVHSGRPGSDTG